MSALYALMAARRDAGTEAGYAQVEMHRKAESAEMARAGAALSEQIDAENSAETWSTIGKVASVVAIVASGVAAVCTCGAASGLLIAAVCLSAGAFTEQEFHVVQKLSDSEKAGKATSVGLGLASAACSLGATAVVACAPAITTGVTAAVNTTSASVKTVNIAASLTSDGMELVGAGTNITNAAYGYAATEAGIDSQKANHRAARMSELAGWVMDAMKEAGGSHARALKTLSGAISTQAQTLAVAGAVRA